MMSACFTIEASPDAQVMPRIFDQFAARGLLPSRILAEADTKHIRLTIDHPGLAPEVAALIAERLRAAVSIWTVELTNFPCIEASDAEE